MDAKWHVIEHGSTIEEIDLYKCITPCKVLDFTHLMTYNQEELLKNIKKDDLPC